METKTDPIASEASHWYDRQGKPVYEVPRAKGDGTRPTTLADARKLDLLPSVTLILGCAAKPGLEAWKARQVLEAALTLPKLPNESLDDYASRVIEDSKQQGKRAAERGTDLHKAIEQAIGGENFDIRWREHVEKVIATLAQYGIDVFKGKTEHSFASPLGYGGKTDLVIDSIPLLCDFKSKANLNAKQLAYPEHCWQLSAYARGVFGPTGITARIINVFVGIDDCGVKIHEWERADHDKAFSAFSHLLAFWQITKNYNGQQQ